MKKLYIIVFILGTFIFSNLMALELKDNNSKIEKVFKINNINGTFLIYDIEKNNIIGYNQDRSRIEYPPASTFKIFNSLIAISNGVIKDVDEKFYKYDGSKMFLKTWETDMDLKTGIKVSHVPAYQQLATLIGYKNMKANISKLDFGNKNIGAREDLMTFWLQGPLKISAIEQVEVLGKLATNKLSYSKADQEKIMEIIKLESGKNWVLYGKTGWGTKNVEVPIGWFVGVIKENGKFYSFALNMDVKSAKDLPLREEITKKSLKAIGLLKN